MSSVWTPPKADLGDMVYWYVDVQETNQPQLGWINERPGSNTVSILVYAPAVGFVEKNSVRHADDPSLLENPNWRAMGAWKFAPQTERLKKIENNMAAIISNSERKNNGGKK